MVQSGRFPVDYPSNDDSSAKDDRSMSVPLPADLPANSASADPVPDGSSPHHLADHNPQQPSQSHSSILQPAVPSVQTLATIFRICPDPITISTLAEGRFLEANPAALEMLGYSYEEVIGQTVDDLQLIVNPAQAELFYRQLQAGRAVQNMEMQYRAKSGAVYVMLTSAELMTMNGEVCVLKICRAINDRRQAELNLERAYRQAQVFADITLKVRDSLQLDEILATTVREIQQFLQADRVLMYQVHPNGVGHVVAEAVVPEYQAILGQDIVDTCLQTDYIHSYRQGRVCAINDIHSGEIQPCHAEFLSQFGVRANLVVPILTKPATSAGQLHSITNQAQPCLWGLLIAHQCDAPRQWQPSEMELMVQLANQVGIALARAELVEALQQSEERRRLALEFSNIGSWDWDMATARIAINDNLFRFLGIEPGTEEITYRTFRDRIHPDDIPEVEQSVVAALANHADFQAECRLVLPDETVRWVVFKGRGVYDDAGMAVRMLGVMLDITPRKRAQLALQQLNEQLDLRIQERTSQLQQLTQELQAEIEERRQVEVALRQSEEQFRVLFTSSPIGKAIVSLDGRFLMVNHALCSMLGYTIAELTQKLVREVTYPDDLALEHTAVQQLLTTSVAVMKFEKRYVTKAGDILWVNITETLLRDAEQNPLYFLRATEDISDRKRIELTLQQQAERERLLHAITQRIRQTLDLDDILESATFEVWQSFQADRALIFQMKPGYVNVVIKEMTHPGYPQCIQMTWADEHFPSDCYNHYRQGKPRIVSNIFTDCWSSCIADFMQEMQVKSKIVAPIVQTRNDDSSYVWGLLIVHACAEHRQWQPSEAELLQQIANQLAIAIQQADLYQQAQRELAERQQAELALRDSEAQYRAIVEDQTELICRYRPDGTLTFVNPAYCRYFGRQPEDFLNQSFVSLVLDEDKTSVAQAIQAFTQGETFFNSEHRVLLPTGEVRWQQWTDRAIFSEQGELVEIQGVGRDITDRKRAEDSLRASLREKEVLLKEVHHRVKNNLQMVSSLLSLQSDMIQNDLVTGAFVESQRRIKVMALVHEKLYRSANLDEIDFADYVQELVYDLFQSYTGAASNVSLHLDIANVNFNVDTAVTCGLIINELVSNAIKYAFPEESAGTISITFTVLHPELSSNPEVPNHRPMPDAAIDKDLLSTSYNSLPGEHYKLQVADSGVGIPGNVDYRNTDSLGLQLVCALTQELGGRVELDCSTGTQFTIWF